MSEAGCGQGGGGSQRQAGKGVGALAWLLCRWGLRESVIVARHGVFVVPEGNCLQASFGLRFGRFFAEVSSFDPRRSHAGHLGIVKCSARQRGASSGQVSLVSRVVQGYLTSKQSTFLAQDTTA